MDVMVGVGWVMLAIGLFGLLTSTVFLGLVLVGAGRFRREARRQDASLAGGAEFLPCVSLFKPLHGAEPGLEENLRGFYEQDYMERVAAIEGAARRSTSGVSRVEVL